MLFIDLDRFKLVNDRADHSAGDIVLNEMANRLTAMTRGVDVVARFGGDEFVAFAEVDHEAGRAGHGRAHPRRAERAGRRSGTRRLVVTASVGVVMTTDGLEHHAGRVCCATPTTPCTRPSARAAIRSSLYRGNARDVANLKWGLSPTRGPAQRRLNGPVPVMAVPGRHCCGARSAGSSYRRVSSRR